MADNKRLFIIDAMALAFRSFYALGRSSLATSQGVPTGAVFGAAMFLAKLIADHKPDYLVAVVDAPGPTFRHELFKDYKATRDKMPADLASQIPLIMELFGHIKMPLMRLEGVEADDVIGTLARRYGKPGLDVMIVSGDKDFMQLVDDHVFMLAPKKAEELLLIDREGVREKFNCTPAQVIDVLALMGDSVDNVPGVRGIGEKGAAKLIETYGSLEGIYEHLGDITAKKQREGLEACRAEAFLSRDLVTLKTDLELPFSLDDLRCDPPSALANDELLQFYTHYELKSLEKRTRAALGNRVTSTTAKASSSDIEAPDAATLSGIDASASVTFTTITGLEAGKTLVAAARAVGGFALSLKASGDDVILDRAEACAVVAGDQRFLVPLNEEGIFGLRALLSEPNLKMSGHSLKAASQMLHNVGLVAQSPGVDLEICDYLLDPNNYNHTLEAMLPRYLDHDAPLGSPVANAAAIWELEKAMRPRWEAAELTQVLNMAEMPLVPVLSRMEQRGIYVDPDMLGVISDELDLESKRLSAALFAEVGHEFNINSPKQLQELLFDQLKLQEASSIKRLKKTKTGYSTDESVLSRLAAFHPVPKLILDYRQVTKLKNTYVDTLPQFMNSRTGRIHTSFRQTVAATGRLSSDKPNLQNIPMRSAMGRRIRSAFKPQNPGEVLISADYSQVELRLLAHMAQAEGLIDAFRRNLDIHTVTAAKIFSVAESDVTPVLRSRAKAVNFGIIYGMGPQRLASETGVTVTEAKDFIRRYFEVYPGIKSFTEGLIDSAKERGYCVTMLGRRRPLPEIRDRSAVIAARGENIAVNAPIQGSAADLVKVAMIRVDAALRARRLKTQMLLQVHDELVFTCPVSERDEAMALIKKEMEQALTTSVPLRVDIKSGKDWLEAH